jgi:toxin ParE1/3/4
VRYLLSPKAFSDLDDIWDYTAETWNPGQADKYAVDLVADVESVASGAWQGHSCDEIRPGYFKLLSGSHVIFYRLSGTTVDVIRILHQRMDSNRHLGEAP